MKNILVFFISLFPYLLFSQVEKIVEEYREKYDKVETVFAGEVVHKEAFWDDTGNRLYTINTINVLNTYKGEVDSVVKLITNGGETDSIFQHISHAASFIIGERKLFFALIGILKTFQILN